jgi:hypothetical protein
MKINLLILYKEIIIRYCELHETRKHTLWAKCWRRRYIWLSLCSKGLEWFVKKWDKMWRCGRGHGYSGGLCERCNRSTALQIYELSRNKARTDNNVSTPGNGWDLDVDVGIIEEKMIICSVNWFMSLATREQFLKHIRHSSKKSVNVLFIRFESVRHWRRSGAKATEILFSTPERVSFHFGLLRFCRKKLKPEAKRPFGRRRRC